jgi:chromosome segregation ATPase
MDVKLQNAYVEVLLDNFMAVVKQNIMIQAQVKVYEDAGSELESTKKAFEEVSRKNIELEKKLTESTNLNNALAVDNTNKQNQVNQTSTLQAEKDRLQGAVNDYMKNIRGLEAEKQSLVAKLDDIQRDVEKQNKYIEQLEEIAPVTKLKKIKASDVEINSGGTF